MCGDWIERSISRWVCRLGLCVFVFLGGLGWVGGSGLMYWVCVCVFPPLYFFSPNS